MKTKPKTVQNYLTFLKDVYEISKRQEPLNIYDLARDHSVSLQAAERTKSIFLVFGSGKNVFVWKKQTAPTITDARLIAKETYDKTNGSKLKKHSETPILFNPLEIFTDQDLIDEIKRRGYGGSLSLTIII
jgi:hypothetical protein